MGFPSISTIFRSEHFLLNFKLILALAHCPPFIGLHPLRSTRSQPKASYILDHHGIVRWQHSAHPSSISLSAQESSVDIWDRDYGIDLTSQWLSIISAFICKLWLSISSLYERICIRKYEWSMPWWTSAWKRPQKQAVDSPYWSVKCHKPTRISKLSISGLKQQTILSGPWCSVPHF